MSGSSLDGVDICYATINQDKQWFFNIQRSDAVELTEDLSRRLKESPHISGYELHRLDIEYGIWIGEQIKRFVKGISSIDVIGLHGHTVFHEPENKLSLQIGRGSIISHLTGLPVVDDFRTGDILLGGQGAPLVPYGEISLFPQYDAWVNLGGIANCTVRKGQDVLAWDIAPCNQVLNYFARKVGKAYDKNGELAKTGSIDQRWINHINNLSYLKARPPKSMSNQWITENVLTGSLPEANDGLFTYSAFLATVLADELCQYVKKDGKILFTGGGAHNLYLMSCIREALNKYDLNVILPPSEIIDFKEALIFGFLGLLRKLGLTNTLSTATGASKNTSSGQLHLSI